MKKILYMLFAVALTFLASPVTHADGSPPASLDAGGTQLTLNGSGKRTRMMIGLYDASLYLKAKSADAAAILSADEPMAMRLNITSSMVTPERMEKATREGFEASTGGDPGALADRIETFLATLREGIAEGDVVELVYVPGTGTAMTRNGSAGPVIEGLDFKSALFGIWIGDKPAQKKLKAGLLGN